MGKRLWARAPLLPGRPPTLRPGLTRTRSAWRLKPQSSCAACADLHAPGRCGRQAARSNNCRAVAQKLPLKLRPRRQVPAYFTEAQREATSAAGRLAGLEVIRLIRCAGPLLGGERG